MRHGSLSLKRVLRDPRDVDKEVFAYLSTMELAELTGVSQPTARRWKARGRLPEPVRRLLEITALGRLDILGWRGWRLIRGELVSEEGWTFSSGEVLAIPFLRQQLSAYQSGERAWRALTPQPEPADAAELLAKLGSRST